MPRIKGKKLVQLNIEQLRDTGESDLKQYISQTMWENMIPKSIRKTVNELIQTGEFELVGTTIKKKKPQEKSVLATEAD